ncbi:hypothetical protein CYMTET_18772, partial [Cymbomonas tetramitiformis]
MTLELSGGRRESCETTLNYPREESQEMTLNYPLSGRVLRDDAESSEEKSQVDDAELSEGDGSTDDAESMGEGVLR